MTKLHIDSEEFLTLLGMMVSYFDIRPSEAREILIKTQAMIESNPEKYGERSTD